jgi:hypothetical protein
MSVTYISAELRRLIVTRAERLCEYCLVAEEDTFYGCEADHIISEKHGGPTQADNLAYACVFCNQGKASDVGSIHWESREFVRFFNPRTDRWSAHFVLTGSHIKGVTAIGAVTERILGFNSGERLLERHTLQQMGRYPNASALKLMQA